MTNPASHSNNKAAAAFTAQSPVFDALYATNTIVQYKRERVRQHVTQLIAPNSYILELNAGTGEDAIWFAQQGHRVHATDISAGMQSLLAKKVTEAGLFNAVTNELCSFTSLENLQQKGPYDLIFSNFAGLNCTGELNKVLQSLAPLLKPGGHIVMAILPEFCLWETLLFLKGHFKTAFRRFFSSKGVTAHIEGVYFKCWYYNPSYVKRVLKSGYTLTGLEGLCTIVPPSYIEHFAEKRPGLYRFLKEKEDRLKAKWPWRSIGDYYIISFRRM